MKHLDIVCVCLHSRLQRHTPRPTHAAAAAPSSFTYVRDGFGLKGMVPCLSLCMLVLCCARLLAYCSITLLAAPWAHQPAYSLRLSRACLARFLACCSVSPLVASCLPSLRLLAIRYRPFSFCLVLSSPFASAPAAVLDLPALQSSSVRSSSFASIDSYR